MTSGTAMEVPYDVVGPYWKTTLVAKLPADTGQQPKEAVVVVAEAWTVPAVGAAAGAVMKAWSAPTYWTCASSSAFTLKW
jgi:hypothetical protein